jgi:hypothetical protein
MPDLSMLGYFRDAAPHDALSRWLLTEADQAQAFVLSLDMLMYGGLVPSRFIDDAEPSLAQRLEVLREIRRAAPAAPIYAFAATMRISNNNVNDEEKSYWAQYGQLIWRWSYFEDRYDCLGQVHDANTRDEARNAVPPDVRDDYLATRARNHALVKRALDLVDEGIVDRLILPQDDTAEYGFNIRERRELQAIVLRRSLSDRVLIYPGADEVMHTLCAHVVSRLEARSPISCTLLPSDPQHIGALSALYEDRPIIESLSNQITAVGGVIESTDKNRDSAAIEPQVILAVHTQGTAQGDWAMQRALSAPQPIPTAWIAALVERVCRGDAVAMLDLAYANGGDPRLMEALSDKLDLTRLAAYAGWNTASNSIGSALAQMVLSRGSFGTEKNQRVLALRLLEDYLYQGIYRQVIRIGYPVAVNEQTSVEQLRSTVREVFIPAANRWLRTQGFPFEVADVHLPWGRTFEIDIRLLDAAPNQGANSAQKAQP